MNENSIKSRKFFAVLLFVLIFAFLAGEGLLLLTAREKYNRSLAHSDAEEIATELSLLSSSLISGDRTMYDDSVTRFRVSLMRTSENEYMRTSRADLLKDMDEYNERLLTNAETISQLLDLSASLNGISAELESQQTDQLDASNFYQIKRVFESLRETLTKVESEELKDIRGQLDTFAQKIATLAQNSAVCVSICPQDSFAAKLEKLEKYKKDYRDKLQELDENFSQKYNPSDIIARLKEI